MLIVTCLSVFSLISVNAVNHSRIDEGATLGYRYDCPDIEKPVKIRPQTLKRLFFVVMDPNPKNYLTPKWTKFDYYSMSKLVEHPTIDFKNKTVLLVGGYTDLIWPMVGGTMGQTYRELGYNVLILDVFYFTARYFHLAVRATLQAAKHVAEMLAELITLGLDPSNLEMVGISLGAHTMSHIAKNYRQITSRNVSSLTALDASGLCFRQLGPDQRLDPSDSDFVLNIATNIDGYGMSTPVGHVTFYVNGGEYQPGDIWYLPCVSMCSHHKAFLLWWAALRNPHSFIGMQCDSVQQARDSDCYERKPFITNTMDLFTDRSRPGIYYLATIQAYPYALGKKGLRRETEAILKVLKELNKDDVLIIDD